MRIYKYSKDTGEYISSANAAKDPLESEKQGYVVYLIPAYATTLEPPACGKNQCAVFSGGSWQIVDDYRGTVYYHENGEEAIITSLGQKVPSWGLLTKPVFENFLDTPEERKIAKKMRELAIEELKKSGDLPIDYVDKLTYGE